MEGSGWIHCVLSYQDTSTDKQDDQFRPPFDLDLRSNFDLDLSRSSNLTFEGAQGEKHNGDIADSSSRSIEKLLVYNFRRNSYFHNI